VAIMLVNHWTLAVDRLELVPRSRMINWSKSHCSWLEQYFQLGQGRMYTVEIVQILSLLNASSGQNLLLENTTVNFDIS
jgi:hypothetical protein